MNRILSQKLWVHFLNPPPITELRGEGTNSAETFRFHRLCSISRPRRRSLQRSAQDPRCSTRDSRCREEEEKRSARVCFRGSSVAGGSSCIAHAHFTLETNLWPDHVSCAAGEAHGEMVGGGQTLDNLHFRSADVLTETGRQAGRKMHGTRLRNRVGCCAIKAPWFWSVEHQKSLQKLEHHQSFVCSFGRYQPFLNISLKSVHHLLLFCSQTNAGCRKALAEAII